jgi:hypothetical protein
MACRKLGKSLMAQKSAQHSDYRLVVRARDAARARDFIWKILLGYDSRAKVVARSIRSFKTMEEPHVSGTAVSERMSKRA